MTQSTLAKKLQRWIRDKCRGFSDADVESMRQKLANTPRVPGGIIHVTSKEMKALAKECAMELQRITLGEKNGR